MKRLPKTEKKHKTIGWFDSGPPEIILAKDIEKETKRFTLLHEIAHAAAWQHSIYLKGKNEEMLCDGFARVVIDLLRRNPDLMKWLND